MRFQGLGLKTAQRLFHLGRKGKLGLNFLRVQPGSRTHVLQTGTTSVQAMVDFGIDEAADNAAACDQAHAGQGNRRIDRAHLETRMRQDEQRPQDAQGHVQGKPVLGRVPGHA